MLSHELKISMLDHLITIKLIFKPSTGTYAQPCMYQDLHFQERTYSTHKSTVTTLHQKEKFKLKIFQMIVLLSLDCTNN